LINEKPKFGIVQGRLVKPPGNELQWFPQNSWESEFYIANALGFKYIELIAERLHNSENPIWLETGVDEIKDLCRKNGLLCYAICNDYIINHGLISEKQEYVLKQMHLFAERATFLNTSLIVLPLFEKSELNEENWKEFIPAIQNYAKRIEDTGVTICLETILNGKKLKEFIDLLNCPNVKCVYDTGNRVAYGHDIYSDIKILGDRIGHVHLKDKNYKDENVLLGNGLVNFYKVFKSFNEINYSGFYTFETDRGRNPIRTALFNKKFCEYCCSEVA
jgi:hexulose-6-phosphate isomerase